MAKPAQVRPPQNTFASPDGAAPHGEMTLTGVVRTTKGYAVAVGHVLKDGTVTITLGTSQSHKEFVALEHKRIALRETLKA